MTEVWKLAKTGKLPDFKAYIEEHPEELGTPDADTNTTLLRWAVDNSMYDIAAILVGKQEAWALTETKKLACWNKVQEAKFPKKPEGEEEEPEEVDVNDEEWQKGLGETVFGEGNASKYMVSAIVQMGYYEGERSAAPADVQLEFDDQLQEKEGFGIFLSPTGDVYAGYYAKGKRTGKGVYKYAKRKTEEGELKGGGIYVGEWVGNKKQGTGKMTYPDDSTYEGTWMYNKRHGKGVYTYPGQDAFVGMWSNGVKEGKGKYTHNTTGSQFAGTFVDGKLVAGKCTSSDGTCFYGKYDTQKPSGKGAFVFSSGVMVEGEWSKVMGEGDGDEVEVKSVSWSGDKLGDSDNLTDTNLSGKYCQAKMPAKVIMTGPPAAGKGTQCEMVVAAFGIVLLNVDEVVKAAMEDEENELGAKVKEALAEKEGVSPLEADLDKAQMEELDKNIVGILKGRISQDDCKEKGWLLDGFPKNETQLNLLDEFFIQPAKCISLEVTDEVATERCTGRRVDPTTGKVYHEKFSPPEGEEAEAITGRLETRPEDGEEAVAKRLSLYTESKAAIATKMGKITRTVDGNRSKEEVFADIQMFIAN